MTELRQEDYKEYGHLCHDVTCWCQTSTAMIQPKRLSRWHGTTIQEHIYRRIAQLALDHKRSVIKEIEYILEKGFLWLESEDQL
jgi:hypothetical protein